MNKDKATTLLLCIAAVFLTASLILRITKTTPQQKVLLQTSSAKSTSYYFTSNTPSSQENSSTTPAQAGKNDVYIVKEYQGHIGVYRNHETKPFKEYETDVLVLPKSDQQELEEGKTAHTMAEVEKMVEDYDG